MRRSRSLRVRGSLLFAATIASAAFCALLLFAYNPEQDNVNGPVPARWQGSATTWSLNPSTGTNVHTNGGDTISAAVTKGFDTWQQTLLNGQRINNLTVTPGLYRVCSWPEGGRECKGWGPRAPTTKPLGVKWNTRLNEAPASVSLSIPSEFSVRYRPSLTMSRLSGLALPAHHRT